MSKTFERKIIPLFGSLSEKIGEYIFKKYHDVIIFFADSSVLEPINSQIKELAAEYYNSLVFVYSGVKGGRQAFAAELMGVKYSDMPIVCLITVRA